MPIIPPFENFFTEDEDSVRARMDLDADPEIDTREGSHYHVPTEVAVKEIARYYDALNETIQQSMIAYCVGETLDYRAAEFGVERKAATYATGSVTFSGTDATLIPQGTRLSAPSSVDEEDNIRFITDEDVTISGGTATVGVTAEDAGDEGNVEIGAVNFLEDPVSGVTSLTNPAATSGGTDIEDDEALRDRVLLEANQPAGSGTIFDYEKWSLAVEGVGAATVYPVWDGPNSVKVVIIDSNSDAASQALLDAVQRELSGTVFVADPSAAPNVAVGAAGTLNGTYTYKVTFLDENGGETGPSVASSSVSPSTEQVDLTAIPTGDTGTVARRIYRAESADPTNYRLVTEISDNTTTTYTDDTADISANRVIPKTNNTTNFDGLAPIGAIVTVDTPVTVTINISCTVEHETGYTLDGAGGTFATEDLIDSGIEEYFDSLDPGEDVVFNHISSRFFDVDGVFDISSLLVDGGSSNVTINESEIAVVGTITLTEAP